MNLIMLKEMTLLGKNHLIQLGGTVVHMHQVENVECPLMSDGDQLFLIIDMVKPKI